LAFRAAAASESKVQARDRLARRMREPGLDRFGRYVNRRELAALARRLHDGERVLFAAEARDGRRQGVLAVTDQRLLLVHAGWLGSRAASWPHADVLGVEHVSGVDDATLTVRTRAGAVALRLRKADAQATVQAVATRPRGPGEALDFALPPQEAARRERLARLDRLQARGAITKAEAERAKRAIADEADG